MAGFEVHQIPTSVLTPDLDHGLMLLPLIMVALVISHAWIGKPNHGCLLFWRPSIYFPAWYLPLPFNCCLARTPFLQCAWSTITTHALVVSPSADTWIGDHYFGQWRKTYTCYRATSYRDKAPCKTVPAIDVFNILSSMALVS
jgi:hypothetical protein